MGVQFVQTFLPEVEGPEAAAILEEQLGPAGYQVQERLAFDQESFAPLDLAIDRHPGASAFILFTRAGDAYPPATLLNTRLAPDRRWAPALARAMSRGIESNVVKADR